MKNLEYLGDVVLKMLTTNYLLQVRGLTLEHWAAPQQAAPAAVGQLDQLRS